MRPTWGTPLVPSDCKSEVRDVNGNLVVTLPGGGNPSVVVGTDGNDLVIAIPGGPLLHIPSPPLALGELGQLLQVDFPVGAPVTVGLTEPLQIEHPNMSAPEDLNGSENIIELPQGGTITVELIPSPRPRQPNKI